LLAVVPEGSLALAGAPRAAKAKLPKTKPPKPAKEPKKPVARAKDNPPAQVKQLPARGRGNPTSAGGPSKGATRPRIAPGRQVGRASGSSGWPG
jgi:hypothetical protein